MAKTSKSKSSNGSTKKAAAGKNTQKPKADKAKTELNAKAQPQQPKADNPTPEKPLTMLQAAEKVLENSKSPMTCQEIVKAMKKAKLWETKTGLTPQNTLNAAINRAMKKQGCKFSKPEKGKYTVVKAAS